MGNAQLSEDEWRQRLTPEEYHVLRQAGTEAPFTGEYTDTKTRGVYLCRACGAELFSSDAKFDSHCGWPSFYQPKAGDAVVLLEDRSLAGAGPRSGARTATLTSATSSRARATTSRPTSAGASTRSRWSCGRNRRAEPRRH